MAIQKIDTVFINGKNSAFGGYVFHVDYQLSFGEQPSLVKITLINEAGVYNISQSDLSLQGAPVLIQLGSNVSFYGYPIEFELEQSPKGKLLQAQYVDESVIYLDKQVVKLKAPGVFGENYINTIVLGIERTKIELVGAGPATDALVINTSATVDQIRVPDIQYTFPNLLNALSNIIGVVPNLNTSIATYYQNYAGNLREVLSAWCNDLGFGFYWANRKLNFIDLTNPANFSVVSSYANSIISQNNIISSNQSYSLRDTVSRGVTAFFGKDGSIVTDTAQQGQTQVAFNCLTAQNIPWVTGANPNSFQGVFPDIGAVQAACYGKEMFFLYTLFSSLTNAQLSSAAGFNVGGNYTVTPLTATAPPNWTLVQQVVANTSYSNSATYMNYNWFQINLQQNNNNFNQVFSKYEAMAKFWGRFYVFNITSDQADSFDFGNNQHQWYANTTKLTDVAMINDILFDNYGGITPYIQNYNSLTLRGFIQNNPTDFYNVISQADQISTEGYLIVEKSPVWTPTTGQGIFSLGNLIVVEGPDNSTLFNNGSQTIFYVGVLLAQTPNFGSIQMPSTAVLYMPTKNISNQTIYNFYPRLEFDGYKAPPTLNVNKYEVNQANITEAQIASSNTTAIHAAAAQVAAFANANPSQQNNSNYVIWSNAVNTANAGLLLSYQQALTPANFNAAFQLYGEALAVSQVGPFFNVTFTVPNINLQGISANAALNVQNGLNGMTISVGDDGIKTTYTIGTHLMKLRSPNMFFRYSYYPATKLYGTIQLPNTILSSAVFSS